MIVNRIGRGSNMFEPERYVALYMTIRNDTKKTIKAAKIAIIIRDVFGDQLLRLGSDIAKTIRPGQFIRDSGEWPIIYESKAQIAITSTDADTSKLTYAIIPKLILFEDGSRFEQ